MKKKNFEESIKRLENIADKMEKNDITLDKSLALYKDGIEEATFCSKFLEDIEQEIYILRKNSENIFKLDKMENVEDY